MVCGRMHAVTLTENTFLLGATDILFVPSFSYRALARHQVASRCDHISIVVTTSSQRFLEMWWNCDGSLLLVYIHFIRYACHYWNQFVIHFFVCFHSQSFLPKIRKQKTKNDDDDEERVNFMQPVMWWVISWTCKNVGAKRRFCGRQYSLIYMVRVGKEGGVKTTSGGNLQCNNDELMGW